MAGTLLLFSPLRSPNSPSTGRRISNLPTCISLLAGISPLPKHNSAFPFQNRRLISRPSRASERPDQINSDGNDNLPSTTATDSGKLFNLVRPFLDFAENNFLPSALICGIALGLIDPTLGCLADRIYLTKFSTFGIFLISGLMLRNGDFGAAAEAWPVGIFGLVSILLVTPFFSRLILQLRLQPQEFVTGLAIFSCMPTTLSSGVALTQLAGGNSALALAMTVTSNLLGILIVPFSISKFIAGGVGVSFSNKHLLRSLFLTLLVPVIFGKVCRESIKGMAHFVDRNRKVLSRINALCLSLVPWIQVSKSRSLLLMVKPTIFLIAVGMGLLLHLILLAFNMFSVWSLSTVSGGSESVFADKQNARAFILVASQKTLPVMLAVVDQLGSGFGEPGLLVLPCVAAHLNQIIVDSLLINLWRHKN